MSEANGIAGRLLAALNGQRITVTGWGTVELSLESATAMRDSDPRIRHVPLTLSTFLSQP